MKKLMLLLSLCLTACASTPKATRIDMPGPDLSVAVHVDDLRPASEKKDKIFSLLVTSSGYGIYRKGDSTLDPPAIQAFRRVAYESLGDEVTKAPITVHHLVVYANAKSALRKSSIGIGLGGALGGAIGGAVAGVSAQGAEPAQTNINQSIVDRNAFEKNDDEYERAYYTDAENPRHASVIVIYIDATIAGKRIFVKTMAPTTVQRGQDAYSVAVQSAIQYWLSQYSAS